MSSNSDYKDLTRAVSVQMRAMRESQPELMTAFGQLAAAGTKDGALNRKTRELVALGIAIACRCDDCIGFHVQTLVKLGTTRAELEDVLGTAVYMGGGPSMMYATHALRAFAEFST
ncbi:Alkylhydroperoxidase AhpD family core domain protein [Paraburkholderia ribeironis]|uniref:Alkylhydroperoxidase AhpD family core domain protein n=1 Tax=Paraburkholderia ribeironis TaxID=1247936 RepID=A0A1N7S2G3_9BURK|nr:carboxymuconolactone decarboxylase family protein [Paraburkholderia ribeironis]SIT41527.1 Alkylhydroperoxidase AhpD family core domain protein [Paraburkholderia ribeironis]